MRCCRATVAALCLLSVATTVLGEAPVRYAISFPNHLHHEASVEVVFSEVSDSTLDVRMSRSSPGRYRLHEFARNVYSFRAFDGGGRELEVSRSDPHGWQVSGHDGTVRVTYRVFGDYMSGTYSAVDETHAHLNPPSVLAWARGFEDRSVQVKLLPPEASWRVATQLQPTDDPLVFLAPDLAYLLDSPIEVSDHRLREWKTGTGAAEQTFRMAIHHLGTDPQLDLYVEQTKLLVEESAAVFGEFPRFDFGSYTFLVDYLPWAADDAMEHRNSTFLVSSSDLARNANGLIATLAHEFFHVWNVERIRPRSLEPFDFDGATFSDDLWFAEGFTNYYDGLLLMRSGILDLEGWALDLSVAVDRIVNSSATRYGSAIDMSRQAIFRDRGQWADPQNSANTYLHYYYYGEAIALALDMELRSGFDSDLDRFMRLLWERFGRDEVSYALPDLERTLADVSDEHFAESFVGRYIEGRETADYKQLLLAAGFVVRAERPAEAWIGNATLVFGRDGARLSSATREGSPLHEAGVDRGDLLVEIGGRKIRDPKSLKRALGSLAPGSEVRAIVEKHDGRRTVVLRTVADPTLEVVLLEKDGGRPTAEQLAFRDRWLGSRAAR